MGILLFIASNQLSPCILLMFSPVFQIGQTQAAAPQENAMKTEIRRILVFLVVLLLVTTLANFSGGFGRLDAAASPAPGSA
jgi:hypothetical protein